VRYIELKKIAETVESLCISAGYELPEDVLTALERELLLSGRHRKNPIRLRQKF